MATPTDFIRAKDCIVTVKGTNLRATDASFSYEIGEVDCTSLVSGSYYEGTTDIIKGTLSATLVVSAAEGVPNLSLGEIVTATYKVAADCGNGTTIRQHTGNLVITGLSETNGPRGSYRLSLRGSFSGDITTM